MFFQLLLTVSTLKFFSVSANWLGCGPPKSFVVQLQNEGKYFIYSAEISVKYDRNILAIYKYPGLDYVNFLVDDSLVDFSGLITSDTDHEPEIGALKTKIFKTRIVGSARLLTNESYQTLSDYRLYLSRDPSADESGIPRGVQTEIIHEAALCVNSTFHKTLGIITANDTMRAQEKTFNFGSISVFSDQPARSRLNASDIQSFFSIYDEGNQNDTRTDESTYGLQSTVNAVVDYAIAQIMKVIRGGSQGRFNIPDLHQDFSTGSSFWKVTGGFDAFGGFFEDIASLRRTHDARISRTGSKFTASCGFGLTIASMEYPKYKLRYGVAKVNGKLSASLTGVALMAAVGVDYDQRPCKAFLQDLQISDLGKLKIRFTGLGPLNKLLSKLVTWITKKWEEEIIEAIQKKLADILGKNLNNFNCEKFRPWI